MANFYKGKTEEGTIACKIKGLECSDKSDCRTCNFSRFEVD